MSESSRQPGDETPESHRVDPDDLYVVGPDTILPMTRGIEFLKEHRREDSSLLPPDGAAQTDRAEVSPETNNTN